MPQKSYNWHKIADSAEELDFSSKGLLAIEVDHKKLCLTLHREQLHACAAKCPHAGGIMADGFMDALGHVVCPIHRYRFNPKNGHNSSGEGYYLKTYPVEIRPEGIFIGLEPNNLLKWLK